MSAPAAAMATPGSPRPHILPDRLYRVFFRELESGGERLRQVVGHVTLHEDWSATVDPGDGRPVTMVRLVDKLIEYVPGPGDERYP